VFEHSSLTYNRMTRRYEVCLYGALPRLRDAAEELGGLLQVTRVFVAAEHHALVVTFDPAYTFTEEMAALTLERVLNALDARLNGTIEAAPRDVFAEFVGTLDWSWRGDIFETWGD
jgi:hypothetical protein